MITHTQIKYKIKTENNFEQVLRGRVNEYMQSTTLPKHDSMKMYVKAFVMLSVYFVPFILVYTMHFESFGIVAALYMVAGLGVGGIGMGIMHDGSHGSFSAKPWVNKLIASTMYLMGASPYTWHVLHNVLHHTYTNIHGLDNDLEGKNVLRLEPMTEWKPMHKYQHIYAWFLYLFLVLNKIVIAEISQVFWYDRRGLVAQTGTTVWKEFTKIIIGKTLYFTFMIGLPIFVFGITWWHVVAGFFIMHCFAGISLACIFQIAHVVEPVSFPYPDEEGNLSDSFMVHQLRTTADFAHQNKFLSWCISGLNYQVEHHLFPHISSIHYPAISKIVEETTKEFGLPYYKFDTLGQAIHSHYKTLKYLGEKPVSVAA